ncbi:RNA-binding protein [Nitzschia inconspicua]|uniref:RNA-binding protein n=1 Tax=Nitzschia inconspicua TaxID=303405 RepID=A0A9K3PT54_9STRA|nr:RNA-binding protein [Nitzschia inconspicua]
MTNNIDARNDQSDKYKIHISRVPTKFTEEIVERILTDKLKENIAGNCGDKIVSKVELIYPRDESGERHGKDGNEAKDCSEIEKGHRNEVEDHRGFGFVSFSSQQALDMAIKLQIVKGGRKVTSKKLYTMHLRPYQEKSSPEQADDQDGRDVCYLWSLHRCTYGDDCKFKHVGPGGCLSNEKDELNETERQRKKKGKCFAYKKGKCSKGDECSFSHDFEPDVKGESSEEIAAKDKAKTKSNDQKDCINWKTKGKCRKGDKCVYRHDPELLKKALTKKAKNKRKRDEGMDGENGKQAKKEKQPLTIRIFGLSYACTEDDVRQFFEECGIINKILFPKFEDSGRSKGYCGIWFASPKAVAKALELDGTEFQGRWLRIQSGKSMELKEWEDLHQNRQTQE